MMTDTSTNMEENVIRRRADLALLFSQGSYDRALAIALQLRDLTSQIFGDRSTEFARSLNDLAVAYQMIGQFQQAESAYQQALNIRVELLGDEDPAVATTLNNMGELYRTMGDYIAAEPLYLRALEIDRKRLGEDDPEYATDLNNLGILYQSMGRFALAEARLSQALEIRRTILPADDPSIAASLNNLGILNKALGNYEIAAQLIQEAVEMDRKVFGDRHAEVATDLGNLGIIRGMMGNYEDAERALKEALSITREVFGENHPSYASDLNNLAELFRLKGDYSAALPMYEVALEIQRTTFGNEHPEVSTTLNNLGELYRGRGKYSEAETYYLEALEIRRKSLGDRHPDFASTLNNLAILYQSIGDYRTSESMFRKVLEIRRSELGENHPDLATSLNNLAALYYDMGNYLEAMPLLHEAKKIDYQTLGDHHPDYATDLNNLAALHRHVLEYSTAESLLRESLEVTTYIWGRRHSEVAPILSNLGEVFSAQGRYAEAEPLYEEALQIWKNTTGEYHPLTTTTFHNLALLYAATGRLDKAFERMIEANAIDDRMLSQVFGFVSERQRMAYLKLIEHNFHTFLSFVLQYHDQIPTAISSAVDLVLRRKGISAEALAIQRDVIMEGRYPRMAGKMRELTNLRRMIASASLALATGLNEVSQPTIENWELQKEKLETELARNIPEMTVEQSLRLVDRQMLANSLTMGAVLIEFVRIPLFDFASVPALLTSRWKPARYIAFVLVAGKPETVELVDLGEAEGIDRMISNFRMSITHEDVEGRHLLPIPSEGSSRRTESHGSDLRGAIFAPLSVFMQDRTRIFIAPDGELTRLPFEVIPVDNHSRIIDHYSISYVSTGRDILRFGKSSATRADLPVIAASPNFDLRAEDTSSTVGEPISDVELLDLKNHVSPFTQLSGTKMEGLKLAQLNGVQAFLEDSVVESWLKSVKSPRILHIATHGFFLPNTSSPPVDNSLVYITPDSSAVPAIFGLAKVHNPLLRSGLVLAGANTWLMGGVLPVAAEDGLLTAEDVSGMDLGGTDLVVLSACETGLGEVYIGEGVFGLRRAFILAGAKTLIMSLWKVPDSETQELMDTFYQRIIAGESRSEALRSAQLAIKAKHSDPFYWGAFICQGDFGPLPNVTQPR